MQNQKVGRPAGVSQFGPIHFVREYLENVKIQHYVSIKTLCCYGSLTLAAGAIHSRIGLHTILLTFCDVLFSVSGAQRGGRRVMLPQSPLKGA